MRSPNQQLANFAAPVGRSGSSNFSFLIETKFIKKALYLNQTTFSKLTDPIPGLFERKYFDAIPSLFYE